jgi:hypothetical protein
MESKPQTTGLVPDGIFLRLVSGTTLAGQYLLILSRDSGAFMAVHYR